MRVHILFILTLLIGTAAIVSAQEGDPDEPVIPPQGALVEVSEHTISGLWQPPDNTQISISAQPSELLNVQPKNSCEDASDSDTLFTIGTGTIADVINLTPSATDPPLSCMWGAPELPQGYRTAWFKIVPDFTGPIMVTTLSSTYDTVLAVHEGKCGQLTELACNDDHNFFTSEVVVDVKAGKEYYIEVADWKKTVQGPVDLNLVATWLPVDNLWTVLSKGSDTQSQRSRHVSVVVDDKIYVIGGQITVSGDIFRTGAVNIYDTTLGRWLTGPFPSMPDNGYSNTTAAFVDGRIYFPSGFVGDPVIYDGQHRVYDTVANVWMPTSAAPNSWSVDGPAIYGAAVSNSISGHGDGYFLTGGLTGRFPPLPPSSISGWQARSEVDYYAADFDSWSRFVPPPMTTGRLGHVADIITMAGKDYLCVAGGLGKQEGGNLRETLASAECLDIDGGNWSAIAPLNHARYFASSGVDENGNWFLTGGFNEDGTAVPITERYNSKANEWEELDIQFNLGVINPNNPGSSTRPPRAWAKGGFVGEQMYVFGGEITGGSVVNLVEKAKLPPNVDMTGLNARLFMPITLQGEITPETYSTMATAKSIQLNFQAANNFLFNNDFVDFWKFVIPSTQQVTIEADPYTSNYDLRLYLYSNNKEQLEVRNLPGQVSESIKRTLSPGTYYTVVERVFPGLGTPPNNGNYRIIVKN